MNRLHDICESINRLITESINFIVLQISEEDDWELAEQAYAIASRCNINIMRGKELKFIAIYVSPNDRQRVLQSADSADSIGAALYQANLTDNIVLGAVWVSLTRETEHLSWSYHNEGVAPDADDNNGTDTDPDREVWRYDFDVVVDKPFRAQGIGSPRIGPKLIETAIEDFYYCKNTVAETGDTAYIRVWVVNPKLARYLEDVYGFESESGGWSMNTPFMTFTPRD